jgi:CheY-like chemotaxis protein
MAIDAGASVGIFHEAAMTMTSPAHPRVLIIDDDLLVAETFLYALTQSGFSVRLVVPATVEQLEFGLGWDPHVALLDVDLVAGDPVSFVDQMRRSGVPVAVMGSEGKQESSSECSAPSLRGPKSKALRQKRPPCPAKTGCLQFKLGCTATSLPS